MKYSEQISIVAQDALEACADAVAQAGHEYWDFYLEGRHFTASFADNWLMLQSHSVTDQLDSASLWQLLQWNAQLPGGVKFALNSCEPVVHARAEIPLLVGRSLDSRVREACIGLQDASKSLQAHHLCADRDESATEMIVVDEIARLCEEKGWPINQTSGDKLNVDLETPHGFYQAIVEPRCRRVNVRVEIAAVDGLPPICQDALAIFLLNTGRQLRMARPVIAQPKDRPIASLEVQFDELPSLEELGHAFAALSIGCRIAAAEAAMLVRDEVLAKECLSIWRVDRPAVPAPIGGSNH